MLLTDRDPITIDDVNAIDSSVADVATVESIPTAGDSSFIHMAVEEAGTTLLGYMQGFGYPYSSITGTPPSYGTILGSYDSTPPPRMKLGQIVVNSDSSDRK